jgi:hypothetical protein
MREEVQIWIEQGRSIEEAIKLLEHFGVKIHPNIERYRNRDTGNAWANDWVYQQLIALPISISPSANTTPHEPPAAVIAVEKIRSLSEQERIVYKEFDAAHANLRHAATDQERFEAAKSIMEVNLPAKDAIFEGKQAAIQGEQAVIIQKQLTAQQLQERNNLRALVSKLTAKISKGTDQAKIKEWKNKLAKAQAELDSYSA